jgi:hypothetical protein
MKKILFLITFVAIILSLNFVIAQDCSDCGDGLFNICDEDECESLGISCTFIPHQNRCDVVTFVMCRDTEGGISHSEQFSDYKEKGTITVQVDDNIETVDDLCSDDGDHLNEYFCKDNLKDFKRISCSEEYGEDYICNNGACERFSTFIKCVDLEIGKSYKNKGRIKATVDDDTETIYDLCSDDGDHLNEYFCTDNLKDFERISCSEEFGSEYYCSNGECKKDKEFCEENPNDPDCKDKEEDCGCLIDVPFTDKCLIPDVKCHVDNWIDKFKKAFSIIVGILGGLAVTLGANLFFKKELGRKRKTILLLTFLILGTAIGLLSYLFFWQVALMVSGLLVLLVLAGILVVILK